MLQRVGMNHEADDTTRLWLLIRGHEAQDVLFGLRVSSLADQKPRRFRHEYARENQHWHPKPLNGKGDAPRPVVIALDEALEDARPDKLPRRETHVGVGCQVRT